MNKSQRKIRPESNNPSDPLPLLGIEATVYALEGHDFITKKAVIPENNYNFFKDGNGNVYSIRRWVNGEPEDYLVEKEIWEELLSIERKAEEENKKHELSPRQRQALIRNIREGKSGNSMKEQKEQTEQKEYGPESYSWANRCLLTSLGLITIGFAGVPFAPVIGLSMLVGSLVLYRRVSIAKTKASIKAIPLDSKISKIKLGFESINHISLTDEDMHDLPDNELKKYYKAGEKAMKGKR